MNHMLLSEIQTIATIRGRQTGETNRQLEYAIGIAKKQPNEQVIFVAPDARTARSHKQLHGTIPNLQFISTDNLDHRIQGIRKGCVIVDHAVEELALDQLLRVVKKSLAKNSELELTLDRIKATRVGRFVLWLTESKNR